MLSEPTFEGFLAFVYSKPYTERFNYLDNQECAFGQYLYSLGYRNYNVDGWGYTLTQYGNRTRMSYDFSEALVISNGSFGLLKHELLSLQDKGKAEINMRPEEVERIERETRAHHSE